MTVETGALTAAVAIALYAWSGNAAVSGADFALFVLQIPSSVPI